MVNRREKICRGAYVQDGWIYIRVTVNGVPYFGSLGLRDSRENRKTAKNRIKKIRADIELDEFEPASYEVFARKRSFKLPSDKPTVAETVKRSLERWEPRLAITTHRDYSNMCSKHIVKFLGEYRLDELNRDIFEKFLAWLDKQISRTYMRDILKLLKSILKEVEAEYEIDTGIRFVKPYRIDHPANPDIDAIFTPEELTRMWLVASPRMRVMLIISAFAGLRPSEVIALARVDADFPNNFLHVRATMSAGQRVAPKTPAGIRRIKMHPVLRLHLQQLLATHNHDRIIISQTGRPMNCRQNFDREYRRVKELAGVRDLRWYALRKFFASIRYACTDAVPAQIAKEMGHTKPSLSLDLYSESMPHQGRPFHEVEFPLPPEKLAKANTN